MDYRTLLSLNYLRLYFSEPHCLIPVRPYFVRRGYLSMARITEDSNSHLRAANKPKIHS